MAAFFLLFTFFSKRFSRASLPNFRAACAILFHLIISPFLLRSVNAAALRPHIVFIIADDLGWNDVSFHGSDQILTPNIDALAYNGIILNSLYTQPVCTPSRAALMTGKYPIHLGMQGPPTLAAEPAGLPLTEKTMANYFKDLGYRTRAVGKWHLGFYKREFTPRYRGFESFYGYYGGFISYYDHILQDTYRNLGDFPGYDLRRNEEPAWQEGQGEYATDLFTKEAVDIINEHNANDAPLFLYVAHLAVHAANSGQLLEAPREDVEKFDHIMDPNRRIYAAMVSKLDQSIGEIVEALEDKKMLKDTIIVFMSDNGAPSARNGTPATNNYPNWGSNYPFRGAKGTLWEGGVRSPSFIWSASIQQNPRVSTNLMHVSDWLPTLYSAAGGNVANLGSNMDGVDQWYTLTLNLPPRARSSVLLNIDERRRNAATRVENWKLVIGSFLNGEYDGFFGNSREMFNPGRPTYNVSAVLESKSGKAVTSVANALFLPWATDYEIQTRRYQATIKCETSTWTNSLSDVDCRTSPCLFNVETDPCEKNNVAEVYPAITTQLYDILKFHRASLVPQINQPVDVFRADPKLWNNTWTTWVT